MKVFTDEFMHELSVRAKYLASDQNAFPEILEKTMQDTLAALGENIKGYFGISPVEPQKEQEQNENPQGENVVKFISKEYTPQAKTESQTLSEPVKTQEPMSAPTPAKKPDTQNTQNGGFRFVFKSPANTITPAVPKTEMQTIVTSLAGVTFDNEDGTNRQDILEQYKNEKNIPLSVEKYKYEGAPAAYLKIDNQTLGCVPKVTMERICEMYNEPEITAVLTEIVGGGENANGELINYGGKIKLTVGGR